MMRKLSSIRDFQALRERLQSDKGAAKRLITVCGETGCVSSGCQDVIQAFEAEIERRELHDEVELKVTGCPGFCEQGPLVVLRPERTLYVKVQPGDIPEIIEESVIHDRTVDRLVYVNPETGERTSEEGEVPFYKHQRRIVSDIKGLIDPTSIDDYVAAGGYSALAKVIADMSRDQVIAEVKESGLRGRGGAGFPTGVKWEFCRRAEAETKYMICNADEGDPGAYMDRSLLEGNPHQVVEGMLIGGYAIGASHGIFYVRSEYPRAIDHLRAALKQAREYGLLGDGILGSEFDFDVEIMKGAGAFVCGEETALIASVEGRRGMPRPRPPYPAQSGLWDQPTNINNVETLANIPMILSQGAEAFRRHGTSESPGTKIFSLVGKVNNTGLIEVPMGVNLREIVFDIGGGIPNGKQVKAVQTGGPSGGCIPRHLLDLPVDYEHLAEVGSIMGSGGMVVMDEGTCMVDVAKFFLDFLQTESCGKCLPCRNGVPEMFQILDRITRGEGVESDLERLEKLGGTIRKTALCGLGNTSPNPVLSTLRYFRDEYEAHIYDRECPARVCRELIYYWIDEELCRGCDRCRKVCPVDAISGTLGKSPYAIDDARCAKCGACESECPFDAIDVLTGDREEETVPAASSE